MERRKERGGGRGDERKEKNNLRKEAKERKQRKEEKKGSKGKEAKEGSKRKEAKEGSKGRAEDLIDKVLCDGHRLRVQAGGDVGLHDVRNNDVRDDDDVRNNDVRNDDDAINGDRDDVRDDDVRDGDVRNV
jgi:hypothetical protein